MMTAYEIGLANGYTPEELRRNGIRSDEDTRAYNAAFALLLDDEEARRAVDACIDSIVLAYDRPGFSERTVKVCMSRSFPAFYARARALGATTDQEDTKSIFGALVLRFV